MLSQVLRSNTAAFHCGTNVTRADRQRTDQQRKRLMSTTDITRWMSTSTEATVGGT